MEKHFKLFDIAAYQLKNNSSGIAYVSKYGNDWKKTTNKELVECANNLSKALLEVGIKPNEKAAILTDRNITEWHIIDLALLQLGIQSVPIYAASSKSEMIYILNHSEATVCFVANSLFINVVRINSQIPTLNHIIQFQQAENGDSIYDYIEYGKTLDNQNQVDEIKNNITTEDIATIIYTSGTTDLPKGVLLTHANLISAANNAMSTIPNNINLNRTLSLLPISHIFERLMLYMYHYRGTTIYFAESIQTVADDMKTVKPDIMSIVPRLLEKIHEKIIEKGDELSGIKKYLFNWALELGYAYQPDEKNGKKYERKLSRARKLVFKKWLDIFGGNLKIIICGGSKLRLNISKVFNAAGIAILEGYGLTESSGVGTVNSITPKQNKLGSVGKGQRDLEVLIADDNEILLKGPMIMKGYFKDPKKTKATFINGYFKTGDLGFVDEEGFLTITGRKKEIFKTSGGKYIVPVKIENMLTKSKYIEQALVVGENEKFPAAIIQPNFEYFLHKYPNKTKRKIASSEEVRNIINNEIENVNINLGQWEKIKKFELTPEEWTTAAGHLTPTLKVKREIVRSKYFYLFTKIYRD